MAVPALEREAEILGFLQPDLLQAQLLREFLLTEVLDLRPRTQILPVGLGRPGGLPLVLSAPSLTTAEMAALVLLADLLAVAAVRRVVTVLAETLPEPQQAEQVMPDLAGLLWGLLLMATMVLNTVPVMDPAAAVAAWPVLMAGPEVSMGLEPVAQAVAPAVLAVQVLKD